MITKLPSVVRIAEGEDLDVSCLITGRLFFLQQLFFVVNYMDGLLLLKAFLNR